MLSMKIASFLTVLLSYGSASMHPEKRGSGDAKMGTTAPHGEFLVGGWQNRNPDEEEIKVSL